MAPRPMLAIPADTVPEGPGWTYELKHDGIRCLAWTDGQAVRLYSRPGRDITRQFPEVAAVVQQVGRPAVLDGELVVGTTVGGDFEAVMGRLLAAEANITSLATTEPAVLVSFDVLQLDGQDFRGRTLEERRAVLRDIARDTGLVVSPVFADGQALFTTCRTRGLEGIVAKQSRSRYIAGRSDAWVKVKAWQECEATVTALRADGDIYFKATVGGRQVTGVIPKGMGMRPPERQALRVIGAQHGRAVDGLRLLPPGLGIRLRHLGLTSHGRLRTPVFHSFVVKTPGQQVG